jgi:hypothetical protein
MADAPVPNPAPPAPPAPPAKPNPAAPAPVIPAKRVAAKDAVIPFAPATDIAAITLQESRFGTVMAEVTFKSAKGAAIGAGHDPLSLTVLWEASDLKASSDGKPIPSALVLTPIVSKSDLASGPGPGQFLCEIAAAIPPTVPLRTGITVTATVKSGLKDQIAPVSKTSAPMDVVPGKGEQPQFVLKVRN